MRILVSEVPAGGRRFLGLGYSSVEPPIPHKVMGMGQIKAKNGFSTLKIGGYHVGTPCDPLLGGVPGLKGLRGLPRFPGLGLSPRGPVAQTVPQRASTGRAQGKLRL